MGTRRSHTARRRFKRPCRSLRGKSRLSRYAQYLELLKERLELREQNKWLSLIKAEVVPHRVDEAEKISRTKYIAISGFLGLFLSLAYLTGRYCWKQSKRQQ